MRIILIDDDPGIRGLAPVLQARLGDKIDDPKIVIHLIAPATWNECVNELRLHPDALVICDYETQNFSDCPEGQIYGYNILRAANFKCEGRRFILNSTKLEARNVFAQEGFPPDLVTEKKNVTKQSLPELIEFLFQLYSERENVREGGQEIRPEPLQTGERMIK